ncbi:MAG: histidinol-phosphate aminotransferase family protein [Lachnospiraceae bacterium]|nr:histidinol-phosphate aminotransferase family protein [Lachnospiraceae bacterium]
MEFRSVNRYLKKYTSRDYAGTAADVPVRLDCSLGVNSDLLGNVIFDRLHGFSQKSVLHEGSKKTVINEGNYAEIKYYPHDDSIIPSLVSWYKRHGVGKDWLTDDCFLLGNGSYGILEGINLMCLTGGRTVLGHAPQFTAYVDHVFCTGSAYRAVPFEEKDNYRFCTDTYLKAMSDEIDLYIIENPNNPTGQSIPLAEIRRIARKALDLNCLLVVDEAYAEYLPYEDSALNLIHDFPNIIVTRSFSKGWGMAGLRLGYAAASPETDILLQLKKILLPFQANALSRALAKAALDSDLENPYDPFGVRQVFEHKHLLLSEIRRYNELFGRKLLAAETHPATPIMMLYVIDRGNDFCLFRHLLSKGLLTVNCESYVGLRKNAVRLMLPEEEHMNLLLEIIRESVRDLP